MSKKIILVIGVVTAIGAVIAISNKKNISTNSVNIVTMQQKSKSTNVKAIDLHKDILRQIASGKDTVAGISPLDAEQELERRSGNEPEIDNKPANVKNLPFEIVKLISKSPASLAGIQPKKAMNELVRRYLSIDLTDSDDVDSAVLLEALNHRSEKKAIEEWAKNEDAEAVEAFLKEEADKDPSSVANFAIGLRKLNGERDVALSYMERYATHAHGDAFDNPNEGKSYKELIEAVKKLKQ